MGRRDGKAKTSAYFFVRVIKEFYVMQWEEKPPFSKEVAGAA